MDVVSNPNEFFNQPSNISFSDLQNTLPTKFWITKGYGASNTSQLNAFDNSLLAAGIGNINIITYSSIIPLQAIYSSSPVDIPPGSQTGIIQALEYGVQGDLIATGIAVAQADKYYVVYEAHGKTSAQELSTLLKNQISEALQVRGFSVKKLLLIVHATIVEQKFGCSTTNIVFEPHSYI